MDELEKDKKELDIDVDEMADFGDEMADFGDEMDAINGAISGCVVTGVI